MRLFLLFVLATSLVACGTNRNVYRSSSFEGEAYQHKTVAILPLQITQTGHVGKNESAEKIKADNEKWSYIFQESLLSYALRHTSKNKKAPVISFQGTQQTNALLKEAGLTLEQLYTKEPGEIAKLLNVDAVIMTTLEKDKNFSDGVAYGLAAGRELRIHSWLPAHGQ